MNLKKRIAVPKRRRRAGFSLMEAVIALAVIAAVSAATLTLIFSSVRIETEAFRSLHIHNEAKNAVECFRYADTEAEFENAIQKTGTYTVDGDVYMRKGDGYTVYLRVNFTDGTLAVETVDAAGETLGTYSYRKG